MPPPEQPRRPPQRLPPRPVVPGGSGGMPLWQALTLLALGGLVGGLLVGGTVLAFVWNRGSQATTVVAFATPTASTAGRGITGAPDAGPGDPGGRRRADLRPSGHRLSSRHATADIVPRPGRAGGRHGDGE